MRSIVAVIRSRAGGSDEAWHSAQARARHTGSFAYVWLDYAMIHNLSRRYRFQEICLRQPRTPRRKTCSRNSFRRNP